MKFRVSKDYVQALINDYQVMIGGIEDKHLVPIISQVPFGKQKVSIYFITEIKEATTNDPQFDDSEVIEDKHSFYVESMEQTHEAIVKILDEISKIKL